MYAPVKWHFARMLPRHRYMGPFSLGGGGGGTAFLSESLSSFPESGICLDNAFLSYKGCGGGGGKREELFCK